MTPSGLFSAFSSLALIGWLLLAAGVALDRPLLRDRVAGTWIPVLFSAAYAALILLFFGKSPGGFGSLADVQLLFTAPWAALAGWAHYLAFDLVIGARFARESRSLGLPRWPLAAVLPLTFLFGPAGFLTFQIIKSTGKGGTA